MWSTLKSNPKIPALLGILLLIAATAIGYAARFVGAMGDEGDTLAVAALLTKGYVLYRDVFSHHTPFSYYWVAAFFSLFGHSINVARLSILLFQVLAFASALVVTRRPVVAGLSALVWSSVGYFYLGNLALYQSLSAIALIPVFLIVYFILNGSNRLTFSASAVIAFFAFAAITANPLMSFPVGVCILFLCLARPALRPLVLLFALMLCGALLYAAYLWLTASAFDFWEGVVTFNVDFYGRYSQAPSENYIQKILLNAVTLLHLLTPERAMFPIDALQSFDPATRWLLSEQAPKITLILLALFLIRRRPLVALFVYFVAAASLFRGRTNFDHLPFVALASTALPLILLGDGFSSSDNSSTTLARRAASLLVIAWMATASLLYLTGEPLRTDYAASFAHYEQEAAQVREMTCGTQARVAYYPNNPYFYFFTGATPVSRYLFMLPWVADKGMEEEREALNQAEFAVVVFRKEHEVWGRKASDFLEPIYNQLTSYYYATDDVYFVSPAVQEACQKG